MQAFQEFVVGKKICEPSGDLIQFDLNDSGAILAIRYRKPSSKEKGAFKSGAAQFKLAQIDGILFFLCRFGTLPWMDAPFHPDFSDYKLQRPYQGQGLALHVVFVDAATGILLSQRMIGLSTKFTSDLLDMAAQLPPTGDDYHSKLQSIYARLSTVDIMDLATSENK